MFAGYLFLKRTIARKIESPTVFLAIGDIIEKGGANYVNTGIKEAID